MREILFRGKSKNDGEWYIGSLLKETHEKTNETTEIYKIKEFNIGFLDDWTFEPTYTSGFDEEVIPETVGQYTGLTDKNGKKIFEGDIVKAQDDVFGSPFCDGIVGKIVYDECAFFIEPSNIMETQWLYNECAVYEVIGNIHDPPELWKGE